MRVKKIFLLLFICLSASSLLAHAQSIKDNGVLPAIISFLLSDPVPTVEVPDGADIDFSDPSDWSISGSPNRDIANIFDNDPSTRWSTRGQQDPGADQYIEINFNTVKTFNTIVIDSTEYPDDYPRGYDVLVSQDGSNWATIVSDYAYLENEIEIVVPVQSVQYLRIVQTGSARNWWSIGELTIFLDFFASTAVVNHVPAFTSEDVVDANRFLNQATFGATETDVRALINLDNDRITAYEMWIDQQMSISATQNYLDTTFARYPQFNYVRNMDTYVDQWFINAVGAPDQLRQRVAWALSQIFVVSSQGSGLHRRPFGLASYYDLLVANAFGNYRDFIEKVTLHPTMGQYLSMAGNRKANASGTISPDENFARELMQLFSIGLVQLNIDGSPITDSNGKSINTYDLETIEGFARVFTGWNYQCGLNSSNCTFSSVRVEELPAEPGINQVEPLVMYSDEHETGSKTILSYQGATVTTIPAGQTGEQDLKMALDNIFNHPNVGILRELLEYSIMMALEHAVI